VLPLSKPRNALEEAEWETDGTDDGGFEREMRLQGTLTNNPGVVFQLIWDYVSNGKSAGP